MTLAKKTYFPPEEADSPLYVAAQIRDNKWYDILANSGYQESQKDSSKDLSKNALAIREDERQKIGHELHDSINSLLVIAKLYLRFWLADSGKEKLAKEQINDVIHTVIENIRHVSSELPQQTMEESLIQLVTDLIKRINGINLIKIRFSYYHLKAIQSLDPELKTTIYRIIQEQLNNTVKYSKAGNVKVRLSCMAGGINLIIKDDGIGFDTLKPVAGIGLLSIKQRVESRNGRIQISSKPGKGCKMIITFPR